MGKFRCPNLHDNEYGEEVCRFTGCPCDCSCRSECVFSTCFDHETGEDD
jgi:hypothetical protein